MKMTYDVLGAEPTTGYGQPVMPARMIEVGDQGFAPKAPTELTETGVDPEVLLDLTLKLAFTVPRLTTQWAAEKLCLPLQIVSELFEQLRADQLVEMLGHSGPFKSRFTITGRGSERARRLFEISGYVGPAPVSLESYTTNLDWQFQHLPDPTQQQVNDAISDLVLPDHVVQVSGLAMQSRRSLFLFGPPGNGKTALGHLLHDAAGGDFWIPHCIGVGQNIIRVFDMECHEPVGATDKPRERGVQIDRRWVQIRRPFVVVGGELTVEALDLVFSPNLGYYEAPLHFKANGGTFLLDDFGCQRIAPETILNRWIHPLERGIDFLTLQTGQQLEVPFRQMLIVSTNLDVNNVMTPAFLRRMGYRVHMADPSADRYKEIFHAYASRDGSNVPSDVIDGLIARYQRENRPMHCCEPRDLVERARDICNYRNQPLTLDQDTLKLVWHGYFGSDEE